ncbi:MAG TPA: ATP:cob(I)alamin adenosyltransferase, partial [Gammaproteobacteria bacterium]|nr:ATP:cob(I)alamin adenosyltransferase [Gammaproteobacteria bacterium]
EQSCDKFNDQLPTLKSFILPGGTPGAALLHQARTVCRRAERHGWVLFEEDSARTNILALKYLNRLSDLLFILARTANPSGDVLWSPGGAHS